jgi:hypothetical protein
MELSISLTTLLTHWAGNRNISITTHLNPTTFSHLNPSVRLTTGCKTKV